MDGTFKSAAKHFYQLFSVHIFENGHYVPLVFVLLENKETESYCKAFNTIKIKCEERKLKFCPLEVHVDFEKGIHNAAKSSFPEAKILGCRFHFSKSLYDKIKKIGLSTEYSNTKSEIGKYNFKCLQF